MICHIIRKELLVNLLSLRFIIGLVVVILMMGIVGYILTEDYALRHQNYLSDVQRHQEVLAQTKVYSRVEVVVDLPPSPLSVFSQPAHDLPTSIRVSPYEIPSTIGSQGSGFSIDLDSTTDRPYNPLLKVFASIDLSFVISIVFSLFALLMVFDSFSGEREQGTLRLLMSYPAGRMQVLIGKFLGALLTMAVPLTVGFLALMLIWSMSSDVMLDTVGWGGIGLLYLVSLLFLSAFLALGLFVSLFASESSSGLMYLLLVWVLVAIVIPQGGGYLAEYLRPPGDPEKDIAVLRNEFYTAKQKIDYQSKGQWWFRTHGDFGSDQLLATTVEEAHNLAAYYEQLYPLQSRYFKQHYRVMEQYAITLQRWRSIRDNMSRMSICMQFGNVVSSIVGADLKSYEAMLRKAQIYQEALQSYLRPRVNTPAWYTRVLEYPELQVTDEKVQQWRKIIQEEGFDALRRKILNWDRVAPLDLSDMPGAQIAIPNLTDRITAVTPDIALLIVCTGVFLGLAMRRALHYRL